MAKHVSFWIGFFCSAIIVVPLAFGIIGQSEEVAREWAVFLFGAIAALLLVLVLLLAVRKWLLQKLTGNDESGLNDVATNIAGLVRAARVGSDEEQHNAVTRATSSLINWYVWSNFYRWVIGTAVGLLLAFGAYAGTILLYEQNRSLAEQTSQTAIQSELLGLSLVSDIGEILTGETVNLADQARGGAIEVDSYTIGSCRFQQDPNFNMTRIPSPTSLLAVEGIANNPILTDRMIEVLEFLTNDTDPSRVFGAMWVLDRLGKLDTRNRIYDLTGLAFNGRDLGGIDGSIFQSPVELYVENSTLSGFRCPSCKITVAGSIISFSTIGEILAADRAILIDEYAETDVLFGGGISLDDVHITVLPRALSASGVPVENVTARDEEYVLYENIYGPGAGDNCLISSNFAVYDLFSQDL